MGSTAALKQQQTQATLAGWLWPGHFLFEPRVPHLKYALNDISVKCVIIIK